MASGVFSIRQQAQAAGHGAWAGSQTTPYVEYLVVAGGAGGGSGYGSCAGSGGGAGGLLTGIVPVTVGVSYTVTVGGGGNGATSSADSTGSTGVNSVFGNITSLGGGGGKSPTTSRAGASGGSGGGGLKTGAGGSGTFGQGNAGGNGTGTSGLEASGGGGAGTVGFNPKDGSRIGANGGAGIASSISGTVTAYAGGGGGAGASASSIGGQGGVGGGGGGFGVATSYFANGTTNTGGGGGGHGCNGYTAANGGSGIVIISYPDTYNAPTALTGTYTASTSGSGSVSFNGTSQYISTPASTNYVFGTGDFTVECWMYMTSTTGSPVLIDQFNSPNGWQLYTNSSQNVIFYTPNTNQTTTTFSLNTWNHIAVSRNSNTLKIYINGVQGYSGTDSTNLTANNALFVGAQHNPNSYFAGYISNVRIVKGTGLYPSAFTPSTIPLTAVSGTSLLLSTVSASQFADSSGNNAIFTATGSPTWNQASPFATGLGYKNRVYTWTASGTVTF